MKSLYLDMEGHETKAGAQCYFETFVPAINSDRPTYRIDPPNLGTLLDRF